MKCTRCLAVWARLWRRARTFILVSRGRNSEPRYSNAARRLPPPGYSVLETCSTTWTDTQWQVRSLFVLNDTWHLGFCQRTWKNTSLYRSRTQEIFEFHYWEIISIILNDNEMTMIWPLSSSPCSVVANKAILCQAVVKMSLVSWPPAYIPLI